MTLNAATKKTHPFYVKSLKLHKYNEQQFQSFIKKYCIITENCQTTYVNKYIKKNTYFFEAYEECFTSDPNSLYYLNLIHFYQPIHILNHFLLIVYGLLH